MQLLSLFLLALSAGALPQPQPLALSEALESRTSTPDSSTAPHLLEARGGGPWIGSFAHAGCQGTHIGHGPERPGVESGCIPFTAKGPYFSIYWGDDFNYINNLAFYSDAACKTQLLMQIERNGSSRTCEAVTFIPAPFVAVQTISNL